VLGSPNLSHVCPMTAAPTTDAAGDPVARQRRSEDAAGVVVGIDACLHDAVCGDSL